MTQWRVPRARGADESHPWGQLQGDVHNPLRDFDYPEREFQVDHGWHRAEKAAPEIVKRFHNRYQHHLEQAEPAIGVPTIALRRIMRDGRLKTQFETGRSGGDYNPQRRIQGELAQHGYPEDHPAHARPVYGYLTKHPYTDDSTFSYGAHTLVLNKDRIWHRTTFSGADSLDNRRRLSPVPVQQYQRHAVPLDHFGLDNYDIADASLDEVRKHLQRAKPEHLADQFWRHPEAGEDINYPEAQFHGGVDLRDVRYAVLRSPTSHGMDDEVAHHAAHLTRAGVPWVHTNGWRKPTPDDPHFKPRPGARR